MMQPEKKSLNFTKNDKPLKIGHIIHPVIVAPTSDLVIAQPITFATMHMAREFTGNQVDVELRAVQYFDEERLLLPGSFMRTRDLTRSVGDVAYFREKRKLAFIKDILDILYESGMSIIYFTPTWISPFNPFLSGNRGDHQARARYIYH